MSLLLGLFPKSLCFDPVWGGGFPWSGCVLMGGVCMFPAGFCVVGGVVSRGLIEFFVSLALNGYFTGGN